MDDMRRDQPSDLGSLLYAVRPLPRPLPVVLASAFVIAIGAFVWLTNGHSLILTLCAMAGSFAVVVLVAGSGLLEHHRVYEHAVVLGLSWPRRSSPYVVPLASVDPASLTVHYRANLIARRLGTGGSPTMRMAVYSTRAVSFLGRSWEEANDALDPANPAASTLRRTALEMRQATFGRGPLPAGDSCLWALGVRDPKPLLEALERAFGADGRPQPGLASRALAHPVVEPSGRPTRPRR